MSHGQVTEFSRIVIFEVTTSILNFLDVTQKSVTRESIVAIKDDSFPKKRKD